MSNGGTGSDRTRLFVQYWLPVLAYVSVIFFLSDQPHLQPPLHFQNSDKLMHLMEYGGLGLLAARAMRASFQQRAWVFCSLLVLGVGLAIAAGDECFQSLIPGRDSSVFDWLADGTGLTFAQLAYLAFAPESKG